MLTFLLCLLTFLNLLFSFSTYQKMRFLLEERPALTLVTRPVRRTRPKRRVTTQATALPSSPERLLEVEDPVTRQASYSAMDDDARWQFWRLAVFNHAKKRLRTNSTAGNLRLNNACYIASPVNSSFMRANSTLKYNFILDHSFDTDNIVKVGDYIEDYFATLSEARWQEFMRLYVTHWSLAIPAAARPQTT